jgi:ARG/rhodanese/phosphatase superfamily protein
MHGNLRRLCAILFVTITVLLGAVISAAHLGPASAESSGPVASSDHSPAGQHGWRLAQPITYENLTIFPVIAPQDADTSEFATLDEALSSGHAVVTEQGDYLRRSRDGRLPQDFSSGAQVNQLVLINRGKKPLVLLAGEVVSGGKQDRIIAKDRIVPVGAAPLPLDVFCVEHGRWTGGSDKFSAGNLMVHPSVREQAAVEQSQSQVWAAVRGETPLVGQSRGSGVAGGSGSVTVEGRAAAPPISANAVSGAIAEAAPTQSYHKIYKSSPIGISVENFSQEVERRFDRATGDLKGEHVVGVVVAFGGEIAWSDIFASSRMFDIYRAKLLRSYAVEALTRPGVREKVSLDDAQDFLRPATGHVEEESEPGIYTWRSQSAGRISEIQLAALAPKPMTLHWLRVLRAD